MPLDLVASVSSYVFGFRRPGPQQQNAIRQYGFHAHGRAIRMAALRGNIRMGTSDDGQTSAINRDKEGFIDKDKEVFAESVLCAVKQARVTLQCALRYVSCFSIQGTGKHRMLCFPERLQRHQECVSAMECVLAMEGEKKDRCARQAESSAPTGTMLAKIVWLVYWTLVSLQALPE